MQDTTTLFKIKNKKVFTTKKTKTKTKIVASRVNTPQMTFVMVCQSLGIGSTSDTSSYHVRSDVYPDLVFIF